MTTSLNEFVGQKLLWQPTALMKTRFELVAGNMVLASFDMSNWSSAATAQAPEGLLSFNKEGFFRQQVFVHSGDKTGPVLATFKRNWSGGDLQFPDGCIYTWKKLNFWGTKRGWVDQTGQTVMVFENKGMSRSTNVFILPESAGIPNLSLFAIAGLYINVITQREAATASASFAAG